MIEYFSYKPVAIPDENMQKRKIACSFLQFETMLQLPLPGSGSSRRRLLAMDRAGGGGWPRIKQGKVASDERGCAASNGWRRFRQGVAASYRRRIGEMRRHGASCASGESKAGGEWNDRATSSGRDSSESVIFFLLLHVYYPKIPHTHRYM